jgi:hypothetical protein
LVGAAVAGVALLAAFGCGGGGNDASVKSGAVHDKQVAAAAGPTNQAATGLQTVTYQGVQFDVPADWPVHDLAADPTTCVRFDVHAVYLGEPGADMSCPAGIIGRADAVLVEPSNAGVSAASTDGGVSATTASGLGVQVATVGRAASVVAADVPSAGVSVTLTYRDSDATAQQILQSFRTAS